MAKILFANPGLVSLSCKMKGIYKILATMPIGTATKQPLEKITFGLLNRSKKKLCQRPKNNLNISVIFFKEKYLLNFPVKIVLYFTLFFDKIF